MGAEIDRLEVQVEAEAAKANEQLEKIIKNCERFSSALARVNTEKISGITDTFRTSSSEIGKSVSATKKLSNSFFQFNGQIAKTQKSFSSFSQIAGSFYANSFLVIRGVKNIWKSVMSSMDYVETYNYWNVALDKIGTEFSNQFEQYGYDSADAYANSFSGRLKSLNLKMTGYSVGESGSLNLTDYKSLGLDPNQLMNYQAKITSVTNAVGLMGETSINVSKALSMLSADMSSFTNTDLSTVMTNFQSGIIGQSRALYKYGIDITNATLQTYAYENGIKKSISGMTQAEKMQLRLLAILDQSRVAWGDQANTLGSVANQYRIMKQQISNLARTIGNLFLPIIKNVIPYINAMVIALNRLFTTLGLSIFGSNWLKELQDGTSKGYGNGIEDLGEDAEDAAGSLNDAAGAAKKLKDITLGIDELNINNPDTDSGSSSDSGAGGFDLSGAISDALADYESVWDKAFAESENKAQQIADRIVNAFKLGDYEGIGTYISNGISSALEKIQWESVYSVASDFGTGLAQFLNGLISPRLFGDIGATIAGALNTVIYSAISFEDEFDWTGLGESIAAGFNNFFDTFEFGKLSESLNKFVDGLEDTLKGFFSDIDIGKALQGIGELIDGLEIDTIAAMIGIPYIAKFGINIGKAISQNIGIISVVVSLSIVVSKIIFKASESLGKRYVEAFNEYWKENFDLEIDPGLFNDLGFEKLAESLKTWFEFDFPTQMKAVGIVWSPILDIIFDSAKKELFGKLDEFFNKNVYPWFTREKWYELTVKMVYGFADTLTEFVSSWSEKIQGWWDEHVTPWFEEEKWYELFDNMQSAFSNKWDEIVEWWNGTAIAGWWEDNVIPWWEESKWYDLVDGMKKGISEKWNDTVKQWKTDIKNWWDKHVSPWFEEEKWREEMSKIPDAFRTVFKNAANSAIEIFNKLIDWINEKMHFEWDAITIAGKEIVPSGSVQLFTIQKIPMFAEGGFPETGELFMARENGINEMVGRIGNRSAVVNNDQIVESVSIGVANGVASAVEQALAPYLSQIAQNTRETADKDLSLNIGDREIAKANIRGKRSIGLQIRTT